MTDPVNDEDDLVERQPCGMCADTGYKDYAGYAMDPCDHVPPIHHRKWAERRLAQACDLIEAVFTDLNQPTESGISETLKRALSAVEEADCELGRYQQ